MRTTGKKRAYAAGLRKVPEQARSRALVDALIGATGQLLVEGGPDAITTNHVADRAGVSIGSLYQYFADKDGLIEAVVGRYAERLHAVLDDANAHATVRPMSTVLRATFHGFVEVERVAPGLGTRILKMRASGRVCAPLDAFEARLERSVISYMRGRFDGDLLGAEAAAMTGRVIMFAVSGTFRTMVRAGTLLDNSAHVVEQLTRMAMGSLERWGRRDALRPVKASSTE